MAMPADTQPAVPPGDHAAVYVVGKDADQFVQSLLRRADLVVRLEHRGSSLLPHYFVSRLLTERELQVLVGMAAGKSNADIGRGLFLSEDTVKSHARTLFRKIGARDRAHAVAIGYERGFLGGA